MEALAACASAASDPVPTGEPARHLAPPPASRRPHTTQQQEHPAPSSAGTCLSHPRYHSTAYTCTIGAIGFEVMQVLQRRCSKRLQTQLACSSACSNWRPTPCLRHAGATAMFVTYAQRVGGRSVSRVLCVLRSKETSAVPTSTSCGCCCCCCCSVSGDGGCVGAVISASLPPWSLSPSCATTAVKMTVRGNRSICDSK